MNTFSIPAYRITYKHFARKVILFAIFWLVVLGVALFVVLQSSLSASMCSAVFTAVLVLDTIGLVKFVKQQLKEVEHIVNCRIAEEGLTLISADVEENEQEIFIPYTEIFEVKKSKNPFDDHITYLRIMRKKVKEEIFVYSDEVNAYDFDEAEKVILEKIKTTTTPVQ